MLSWLSSHDAVMSNGEGLQRLAPFKRLEKTIQKTDRARIVSGTNSEEGHVEMSRSLDKLRGETPGSHPDQ